MFGVEVEFPQVLPIFTDLSEIYTSYLNLEDKGSIAIANALKGSAPSLEVLEMEGNDITAEAGPALAACVGAKQVPTKLKLVENELKDEGAILIAKALEDGHGQLTEPDMSTNEIRRAGARCLAQAVVSKPGFKVPNINGNFIYEEGIDEVKDILKNSLHVLALLDDNDPEGEGYGKDDEDADTESEYVDNLKQ